jgi:predicted MPP superfamily phosphohydrolase
MTGDSFKILQLSDIHWNFATNVKAQSTYLTKVVTEASPDMIMITGDSCLCANESIATSLYNLFDSWNIPFGVTFGNHDKQGLYSKEWVSKLAASGKNSLYNEVKDNVFGDSNYFINVKKDGKTVWQIYSIDSNSNEIEDGSNVYDYIHDDQVEWFKKETALAKTNNGGVTVPSLAYYHIPLWEYVTSYYVNHSTVMGEIGEKATNSVKGLTDSIGKIAMWPGEVHSKFFEAAKEAGVKAGFCGHDHNNDWVGEYEGIKLGYCVKSGRELYYTKTSAGYDMTGGSLVTIKTDSTLSIEHIFVDSDTYKVTRVAEGDK